MKKSIDGYVTIKAESLRDLNSLQVDLAENLSIKKVTYGGDELFFSREYDAVLIDFISTIKKDSIFEFTVFYQGIPQSLIIHRGR